MNKICPGHKSCPYIGYVPPSISAMTANEGAVGDEQVRPNHKYQYVSSGIGVSRH